MTGGHDDLLNAALIQIAEHAERIADLDEREATHHQDTGQQVEQLGERAGTTGARIDALTIILGRHAAVVNSLDGLDDQVAALARQLDDLAGHSGPAGDSYEPGPAPRWWRLTDTEREAAIARLRAWVEQVYRPGYGHLAAAPPACWELHPLCWYTLDWLSELWSALYLDPRRAASTLAGQAEWQTRLLPAAASQMASDATGCRHSPGSPHHPGRPGGPSPGRGHAPRPR
jgi:hypothetical protein